MAFDSSLLLERVGVSRIVELKRLLSPTVFLSFVSVASKGAGVCAVLHLVLLRCLG